MSPDADSKDMEGGLSSHYPWQVTNWRPLGPTVRHFRGIVFIAHSTIGIPVIIPEFNPVVAEL